MNDKELLVLAAKAAEIEIYFRADKGQLPYGELCAISGSVTPWDPLTDDGDALRLAVKLGMSFVPGTYKVAVEFIPQESDDDPIICVREGYDNGPYAATRRAIVRAAAEIGKAEQ